MALRLHGVHVRVRVFLDKTRRNRTEEKIDACIVLIAEKSADGIGGRKNKAESPNSNNNKRQ